MGRLRWSYRSKENGYNCRNDGTDTVNGADLYLYFSNSAPYDESDRENLNQLGSIYLNEENVWVASVGYSMATKKSSSHFYVDQAKTQIIGEYPTIESAKEAVQRAASIYLTNLAEQVGKPL